MLQVTNYRGIVSAGCEIPPDTPLENMVAYRDAAHGLSGDGEFSEMIRCLNGFTDLMSLIRLW